MDNIDYEERYEIIEGERIIMAAAAPSLTHGTIIFRLGMIFGNYIKENNVDAAIFADNTDVLFNEKNTFMPDLSIVCNAKSILTRDVLHVVPDLVVEVLSRSTAKKDFGRKKDVYERCGVKEYWIINPADKSIQVYHLIDGKFKLDDVYQIYSEDDLKELEDDEKAAINYKIKVTVFDDLYVDVHEVFRWWTD